MIFSKDTIHKLTVLADYLLTSLIKLLRYNAACRWSSYYLLCLC